MRLFVTTYRKYSQGSLKGDWIDLEGQTKESFLEEALKLHNDETDPELMFPDKEDIPDSLYSESSLKEELFDYADLSEEDKELWELYDANIGGKDPSDIREIRDEFLGEFSCLEEYARAYWENSGFTPKAYPHPSNYIDWERVGEDMRKSGSISVIDTNNGVMIFLN